MLNVFPKYWVFLSRDFAHFGQLATRMYVVQLEFDQIWLPAAHQAQLILSVLVK
jgi:hypothetical protein